MGDIIALIKRELERSANKFDEIIYSSKDIKLNEEYISDLLNNYDPKSQTFRCLELQNSSIMSKSRKL